MIRLSKSTIGNSEKQAVLEVLGHEYLGMGKEVDNFERMLADYLGRQVVCVNSGTAALHLAFQAIGLHPGDEVLVQSLTFIATYQAISATGASPVSCEVDPKTITLDLNDAEKRLTDKTKAVVPVHYASGVGDLNEIYAFAEANGLRVIEDAAHAFGTHYQGKVVGSFGDIVCFSFDGIKNITSGEGGAIVTEDQNILKIVKDARLLGVEKDTEKRYKGERSWHFDAKIQGWRYHMSNLMAAIGCEQLKRLPETIKKRDFIKTMYLDLFQKIQGVEPLLLDYKNIVPHIFVVRVTDGKRDGLRRFLLENDIECGVHYFPNHMLTKYKSSFSLSVTEQVYGELLSLPFHLDLTQADLEYIVAKIKEFFDA
ncbi:DegT/DnrJ/EryC1/StrS family aminotransferase [uncultured Desulfobacter sp.]|uniref:DegT/DnrJ/EryC1/StrS family aminotransferase n=1 Tax=uncultured Desulfobacter sp. TaxID=240139 RepID=UPI002AABACB0|nr:DegT/DnrJ/EryC1/StrS family aminotransferase [uncultured Desulfobacter sp.]